MIGYFIIALINAFNLGHATARAIEAPGWSYFQKPVNVILGLLVVGLLAYAVHGFIQGL